MITDSVYWKAELRKINDRMIKRKSQKRWVEPSFMNFEKDVFVAFYIIRKLIEAYKLTIDVEKMQLHVISYPSLGKSVDLYNWHRLDEYYDFSAGKRKTLSILKFAHQVVHSYIFSPAFEDNVLSGFIVASDRDKKSNVYQLAIDNLIKILDTVADDEVVYSHAVRSPETGELEVKNYDKMPKDISSKA